MTTVCGIPRRTARQMVSLGCALFLAGCGAAASGPTPSTGLPQATVLATIPTGAGPTMLALSPDGSRLYAAAKESLNAIDTSSNQIVGRVGVAAYTAGIAVAPNGSAVYLTNISSTSVAAVNTATMTKGASYGLLVEQIVGGYGRLAVSPDGGTAYVTNGPNSVITVAKLGGGGASDILLDMRPADIVLSTDGAKAYICGCKAFCTSGTVEVLDIASQAITATVSVGPQPYRIMLSPDGRRVYTNNLSDGTVSVVDLTTASTVATTQVGPEPTGLAVSPDGRLVYAGGLHTGILAALDAVTGTLRSKLGVGAPARDVVVSRDGTRAYVATMDTVLVVDTGPLRGGA
jgi:YVTN family beta-propeller protein